MPFKKVLLELEFAICFLKRNREFKLTSGFEDFQIMKTTQSGFSGYIKDEYTTLKETKDRVLCTKVKCTYEWDSTVRKFPPKYTQIYENILKILLEKFAGDPVKGVYSASVQNTVYEIGDAVLKTHANIKDISFSLPNIHFYHVNFDEFKTNLKNNSEVYFTQDGAHGQIEATIVRYQPKSKM